MRDALCSEHPELSWFPPKGGDPQPAKLICARCLVKVECRSWAIDQAGDLDGIWGGTSKAQRQQARRAVAPVRQVTPEELKERVSSFLAAHPGEAFTASGVRNGSSGSSVSIARALAHLADAGYATVVRGGTTNGRHYADARFYAHAVLYVARGAVTRPERSIPAA